MTEPDVTLTDYVLAIESAVFAFLLYRRGDPRVPTRPWFILLFASIAVATLAGGTVHGFFLATDSLGYRVLWPLALVAGGVAALATWAIGAKLRLSHKMERRIIGLAVLQFLAYCAALLWCAPKFYLTLANYLAPTLFLLVVFYTLYHHMRIRELKIGALGLFLTLVAAALQLGRVALHPLYFNHNAVYHALQAAALFMIFWAARWLTARKTPGVF